MKYFLIGFAIWFMGAWFPQFVKGWINVWKFKRAGKKAAHDDKWMYNMWNRRDTNVR